MLCRRYMDDPSFTEEQLQLLAGPGSADTRRMFNVLTDEEVAGYKCGQCVNVPLQVDSSVRTCLASLAGPVQVVWRDQRCLDCGETGDRRGPALVTRPRRHGVTAAVFRLKGRRAASRERAPGGCCPSTATSSGSSDTRAACSACTRAAWSCKMMAC